MTDDHPALIVNSGPLLPYTTLVLPEHLTRDETISGLVQAITAVQAQMANQASDFHRLVKKYAFSGDHLRQALCRGQMLAYEAAALTIEEEIVETFDLLDQWDTRDPTGDLAP